MKQQPNGKIENIPYIDELFKENQIRGILIGGVAWAFHRHKKDPERAQQTPPRKDTDILMIDEDLSSLGLNVQEFHLAYIDLFTRHSLDRNVFTNGPETIPSTYWVNNLGCILDTTFPNIDQMIYPPGLIIPDELFLLRMDERWRGIANQRCYYTHPLKKEYEDKDPWNRNLLKVKYGRMIFGDPEGVTSMDDIQVRPITRYEKKFFENQKDKSNI